MFRPLSRTLTERLIPIPLVSTRAFASSPHFFTTGKKSDPKSNTPKVAETKKSSISAAVKPAETAKPVENAKTVEPQKSDPIVVKEKRSSKAKTSKQPKFRAKYPDMKITEITKKIGENWRNLGDEEKQTYQQKYLQAKAEWQAEEKNWLDSLTSLDYVRENIRRRAQKLKPIRDPNAPRRPQGSYMCFASWQQKQPENSKLTVMERGKLIGEKWKSLKPENKKVFEEHAARDRERYDHELLEYNKQLAQLNQNA
ncbi:hypothetical protein G9A89_003877 [Geosiphon pyriformis]|nr:hypothetical protein G9A89_003877 [Geosiphon pyriformis]